MFEPRRRSRWLLAFTTVIVGVGVFASAASAAPPPPYYPYGPQQNVPVSTVTSSGWTQCFIDTYAGDLHAALPGLLSSCTEDYLMLAGRPTGSSSLTLLAAAPRGDVLFDTGPTCPVDCSFPSATHTANGSAWYFHDDDGRFDGSWGFAAAGDPVANYQCDVGDIFHGYGDSTNRLCWHLLHGFGGLRLGSLTFLTGDSGYERLVLESNGVTDSDLALARPSEVTVNATSPVGALVNYLTPKASDESVATVTVSCSPASGSKFAIGDTTVTCTATDTDGDAGSPVQQDFNVHVEGAPEQLADLADAVKGVGPGTSLADKVASVQSDLASEETGDACAMLSAFDHEVQAQSGKQIPAGTARTLIPTAQRIQAVMGCGTSS